MRALLAGESCRGVARCGLLPVWAVMVRARELLRGWRPELCAGEAVARWRSGRRARSPPWHGTHCRMLQVAKAAVGRGIAVDGTIGFILLRVCFNKIRRLWKDGGYPLPIPNEFENGNGVEAVSRARLHQHNGNGAVVHGDWADRMMHALTGRLEVAVLGDGPDDPLEWRNRAHLIYRCFTGHHCTRCAAVRGSCDTAAHVDCSVVTSGAGPVGVDACLWLGMREG